MGTHSKTAMYTCRKMDLLRRADLALGGNGYIPHRRMLFQSPYLYGCEVKPVYC